MWLIALFLLLMMSAIPTWGAIYKCPDGKGGMVLQDMPYLGASAPAAPVVPAPAPESPPVEPLPRVSPHATSDATCAKLREGAQSFAILRDRGMPASTLLAQFTAAATKTPGAEGIFWEEMFRSIILQVYTNTWWTPSVARQRIELTCLQGKK